MSKYRGSINLRIDVEVEAESTADAEDLVWREIELGTDVSLGDLKITYVEIEGVEVR